MNGKRTSIARKLLLVTVLLITVAMLTVGAISLFQFRSTSIEDNGNRALAIAKSVASAIDGDELEAVILGGNENEYSTSVFNMVNKIHTDVGTMYLYVLHSINDNSVSYFADGHLAGETDYVAFGDTEDIDEHDPLLIQTYRTGNAGTTDIYETEGYGSMVSGYAAIRNSKNVVVGVVGADISVQHINSGIRSFGIVIFAAAVALSILFGLITYYIIKRTIGRPVAELTAAANRLAAGDTDIGIQVKSNDEIGQLIQSFISLESRTKEQVTAIQKIADGNYAIDIVPANDRDVLNIALQSMLSENNRVFSQVQNVASQVASTSSELASGAQNLAQGSTEQASSTAELSQAIGTVLDQTRENARSARETLDVVTGVSALMQESMGNMEKMREAMSDISASSDGIGRIIKTIDDIAFQTNILALNASVEAARAGQYGKGFAVVADEVRNLASKSAEAASETATLILKSVNQVAAGDKIVRDTSAGMRRVAESTEAAYEKIRRINDSATRQEAAVEQINTGIEQIAQVVQMNSATSEQSAAMSHEMNDQAKTLSEITERFRLRKARLPGSGSMY